MKSRLPEHTLSIILVALAFTVLVVLVRSTEEETRAARTSTLEPYLQLDFMDFGNPLHRALFRESLDIFYPDRIAANDSLMRALERYRQEQFTSEEYKTGGEERVLTWGKAVELGGMFLQFAIVYVIVMFLSYHAAQSMAIVRFVNTRANRRSSIARLFVHLTDPRMRDPVWYRAVFVLLLTSIAVFLGFAVLFAPAYVIAYSIRSGFDAGSYPFMILLAVISNGLLITRANRFYTFLLAEHRKGYVQTAVVKNLSDSYHWGEGFPYRAVLSPGKILPSHVFRHVFLNAHHQYLPSLKEHASFLITGLIIIEMALNIQGHLGYELLQNILYRRYDVAATIIVGIFVIVKVTDIVIDAWVLRETHKYENKA
jgi:hypothetical protein